jgi:hypothetical protein
MGLNSDGRRSGRRRRGGADVAADAVAGADDCLEVNRPAIFFWVLAGRRSRSAWWEVSGTPGSKAKRTTSSRRSCSVSSRQRPGGCLPSGSGLRSTSARPIAVPGTDPRQPGVAEVGADAGQTGIASCVRDVDQVAQCVGDPGRPVCLRVATNPKDAGGSATPFPTPEVPRWGWRCRVQSCPTPRARTVDRLYWIGKRRRRSFIWRAWPPNARCRRPCRLVEFVRTNSSHGDETHQAGKHRSVPC